jgi:hypothetical protein
MQYPRQTSTPEAIDPVGTGRGLPVHELDAMRDARLEDHHFQYPTVVPVSRPVPVASREW